MNRYKLVKAGIDVKEGIHRFNENKEMYEKFLNGFPEDVHYDALLKALEQKDAKEAFQAAHALKGITGNLSLNELHQNLLPLVEELRAEKLDRVAEFLPAVQESYDKVMEVLKTE